MDEKTEKIVTELLNEDKDRDYYFISHEISRDLHRALSLLIEEKKRKKKATVFLNTGGGNPDAAFRIARCLRHYYEGRDNLRIAIPNWCKSAGTLIAIAAGELGIGDFGELGPLDIQVYKGSELQERSSGLDIVEAMGAVTSHVKDSFHLILTETRNLGLSTKISAEFAAQVTAAIASPLFSQLDPLRFGELSRLTRIAEFYGNRLNKYGQNLKSDAITRLIHEYPSHSFVIDRKEAKELFERVTALTPAEKSFCDCFWQLIQSQANVFCHINLDEEEENKNESSSQPSAEGSGEPAGSGGSSEERRDSGSGEKSLRARPSRQRSSQGSSSATN